MWLRRLVRLLAVVSVCCEAGENSVFEHLDCWAFVCLGSVFQDSLISSFNQPFYIFIAAHNHHQRLCSFQRLM